jgi:hypothetical protein
MFVKSRNQICVNTDAHGRVERPHPTRERILELFSYYPETGNLVWKMSRGGAKAGAHAGHLDTCGYWQVGVDRRQYQVHQLIWLIETGVWADLEIDHKDTVKTNNRFGNLRLATHGQNNAHREVRSNSKTGLLGVHERRPGKYTAQIRVNKKHIHLGTFSNKNDAAIAYAKAAYEYHGEFAAPSIRAQAVKKAADLHPQRRS